MKDCNGWLLMSDLDGTLLNNLKQISTENRVAIETFVSLGGLFSIATGRTELTCRLATDHLPIHAPIVLYNGAAIYNLATHCFLWTQTLETTPFIPLLKRLVQNYPTMNIQVFQGGPLLLVNQYGDIDPYIIQEDQPHRYVEWDEIQPQIFKIMFRAHQDILQSVEQIIIDWRRNTNTAFELFFSADYYLEIVPPKCSKGACLSWICRYLHLSMKNTLAIGDQANDVDMLRRAEYSAAPANAIDAALQTAQIIVADCDHHAVCEFLYERF